MGDDVTERAKSAAQETMDRARAGTESVRHDAARLGEQMREAAQSLIAEQKDRLADAVHGLAEAFRHAAETLEHDEKPTVAGYAGQVAEQIDRLSENVRGREIGEILANAEDFARRQPALFLAGAVAAGFVVGRLLTRPSAGDGQAGPARGYATTGGEGSYHRAVRPVDEAMAGYGAGASGIEGG